MPSAPPARAGEGEIRSLTGLRGCAAIMVMLYHFALSLPGNTLPFERILQNGYLWVDLFFVLSGFVMAYSQSRFFATGYGLRAHTLYLISRLARIYPLYAVITLESACLSWWRATDLGDGEFGRKLLLNLILVQAWGLAPSFEGAAWSISTEWGAYLLFPLLLLVAVSSARWMAAVAALLSFLAILYVALSPEPVGMPGEGRMGPLDTYSSATPLPLIRCIAEFSLGLLTFRVWRALAGMLTRWAVTLVWGALILIVVGLAHAGWDLWVVSLFPVLLVALAQQDGVVDRLLGGGAPYRLGQWSYSIYLIHDKFSHPASVLRAWLEPRVPFASEVTVVLLSGVVIVCGAMTYLIIELPLRHLVLRVVKRLRLARSGPSAIVIENPS